MQDDVGLQLISVSLTVSLVFYVHRQWTQEVLQSLRHHSTDPPNNSSQCVQGACQLGRHRGAPSVDSTDGRGRNDVPPLWVHRIQITRWGDESRHRAQTCGSCEILERASSAVVTAAVR